MTTSEAIRLKAELQEFCKKNKLWWDVLEKGKPELKDIILTVSIRITEK